MSLLQKLERYYKENMKQRLSSCGEILQFQLLLIQHLNR